MANVKNDDAGAAGGASAALGGEHSPLSHSRNPATVSSLSSLDTAGYDYNDSTSFIKANEPSNNTQQSTIPHPLPPISSSNSISNDHSFALSQSYFQADSSQPQQPHEQSQALSSHLPISTGPLLGQTTMRLSPNTRVVVPAAPTVNTVPEFLCSLTKMLTDNNRDIIEWSNGKIEVHNPHKLEAHVLNRYFRHSKFASFQRQLNYFGFRKLAGKGKMAPCSYVNDCTTNELGSLLLVKRKQGNEPNTKKGKKRDRESEGSAVSSSTAAKPQAFSAGQVLPNVNAHRNPGITGASNITVDQSQKALARVAVGKGVRHGFVPKPNSNAMPLVGRSANPTPTVVASSPVQDSLNALTNNYRNSLNELQNADKGRLTDENQGIVSSSNAAEQPITNSLTYIPGSLRRDDSLVDLAMIPLAENENEANASVESSGFSFVDFPFDTDFFKW
ncbi:HSF-type DNA-binding protein [Nitzschia inconspicua]|uniref:HSF-type DNA-binding protein n=1 Tax=Nitzschia inconspicua TaxID=303405 RepID=A0A9K3LPI9_9STRA|nr:HSF-type DNA-binding protein [Nitzschia inconspicua]